MLKILFDFLPIALFFVAFKAFDLIVATQVAIVASLLQLIWLRWTTGKIQQVNLISFLSILILGGATIFLKNDIFVKWKPTVVYWLLSLVLFGSQLFSAKPLMQRLAGASVKLADKIWRQINLSWGIFFCALGFVNLYVVYNFDTATWVNFKLFGTLGITLVFIIAQSLYMAKHTLANTQTDKE